MSPRKKNVGARGGLGENQQAEVSVDHVFMHTESSNHLKRSGNQIIETS